MSKKPHSAPDREVHGKVVRAISQDLAREYENAPQVLERLDQLERVGLMLGTDLPSRGPIERELMLAYIARQKRDFFPLHSLGANSISEVSLAGMKNYWREHAEERRQLRAEIRELEGLIWGKQLRTREFIDQIWSNEFWTDLNQLGVFPRDTLSVLDSLIPRKAGRPVSKRPLAVKALQLKLAGNLSWQQVTNKVCECGQSTHDHACVDRLKKEVKSVQKILSKYGLDYRTPQQRQSAGR